MYSHAVFQQINAFIKDCFNIYFRLMSDFYFILRNYVCLLYWFSFDKQALEWFKRHKHLPPRGGAMLRGLFQLKSNQRRLTQNSRGKSLLSATCSLQDLLKQQRFNQYNGAIGKNTERKKMPIKAEKKNIEVH